MSQINQTNMQQPIGWTNPPPSKTSSETIGADILNMYLSALVKRKGTTLPSDIQDGEIWQHQVNDTDSEFYLWRTSDGTNFGTHIPTKTATNEELDKDHTEAELVALAKKIINARQFVELAGKGGLGVPLGFSCIWAEPYIPEGAILYNGELNTNFRSAYPDFYDEFIKTGKVHAKPMSEFASVTAPYWQDFFYDDTTGDVRLPKPAPYIGATAVDTASLGEYVEAGLPNITGKTSNSIQSYASVTTEGAFTVEEYIYQNNRYAPAAGEGNSVFALGLDLSASNPTYGKSETVTPEHMRGRWIGFVYNGSSDVSEAQVQEFVNLLAGKANAEDNVDGLVDYYPKTEEEKLEANGSWWRKYKSGWIEQGGIASHNVPVIFAVPFSDNNYTYTNGLGFYNTSAGTMGINLLSSESKTPTQINFMFRWNGGATGLTDQIYWEAKGY